ncbi:MAG: class I SAM-dependent rRNA methyltransferase [Verrucomicrobiota bacterium]
MKLKRGRNPRVLSGHPWVYLGEVQRTLSQDQNGAAVACFDSRGRCLGSGIYNENSQIIWRRFSQDRCDFDESFLRKAIHNSLSRRNPHESVKRLIWSEADSIPGLVVDQYDEVLVMQCLTLAVDQRSKLIADILCELTGALYVVLRNDAPVRTLEGLDRYVSLLVGNDLKPSWIKVGDVEFWIDFMQGQKTGFYLDQRYQYLEVAKLAKDKHVLDTFCNQGGFALHCARHGAASVLALDSSEEAVNLGRKNAEHNQLSVEWMSVNVFDYFSANKNKHWDLIILDPPSFARNKNKVQDAVRGYNELNLRALQALNPGGILATYSCSHHISHELFEEVLVSAAADAHCQPRLLNTVIQPQDHPVILGIPETEYLKGMILEV